MTLPQGNKSEVDLVQYHGVKCVRKRYNDNGDPFQKATREVAFYRYYDGLTTIPKLLREDIPNQIYITHVDGELSRNWIKRAEPSLLEAGSYDYGKRIGELVVHQPEPTAINVATELLEKTNVGNWLDFANDVLSVVDRYFSENDAFDIPKLRELVHECSQITDVSGYWGQQQVCKLDWNAGNTFMNATEVAGFIDFEQAFMGNRLAFIGTVIDHIHGFDWPSVRRGILTEVPDSFDSEQLILAANFSMLYKVSGCCSDGRIGFFTPERLVAKFANMHAMIESAEQGAQPDAFGAG